MKGSLHIFYYTIFIYWWGFIFCSTWRSFWKFWFSSLQIWHILHSVSNLKGTSDYSQSVLLDNICLHTLYKKASGIRLTNDWSVLTYLPKQHKTPKIPAIKINIEYHYCLKLKEHIKENNLLMMPRKAPIV